MIRFLPSSLFLAIMGLSFLTWKQLNVICSLHRVIIRLSFLWVQKWLSVSPASKISCKIIFRPAIAALSNIANKWDRQHPESSEIFFGFVDFAHHLELIRFVCILFLLQFLQLQVHTAPFLFHIAPRQHLKDWIKTNHHEILSSPSLLAEWISKVSGSHVSLFLCFYTLCRLRPLSQWIFPSFFL